MPNVKTGKKKDIYGIIGFDLNDNNAKLVNSIHLLKFKRGGNVKSKKEKNQ